MVSLATLGTRSLPVLAQTTVAVPAIKGCVDSGINVSRGEAIQFSAIGQASYGYEGEPVNSTPQTNADGDRFVNGINIGKKNDPNAIYQGSIGALVGKINLNGNYFLIGSGNQIVMGQSGRLFLCYNDVNGYFNNNSGAYSVSIYRRAVQPRSTTRRSPNNRRLPARTASGQELLVASNLGCTNNLRSILGQSAPNYCTSAEANSGISFDRFQVKRNSDRSINLEMRVFNRGSADGLVEVYDSSRRLVNIKIIDGNIPPTGLIQSGRDLFTKVPASIFSRYPIGDSRRDLKEQNLRATIPAGGFLKISKSSNMARLYNTAILAVEVAMSKQGDPEFAKSETGRKFIIGFAQEFGTKGAINIFKGEPSVQAGFSLDFIDKNKLAEVLQKLVQYSVTIESDPFKNPLSGAFSDVFLDGANIGIENALDKYILPGLGTVARGVRQGGNAVNIFARAADLSNATLAGEKATVTLRDASSKRIN
jgi:hypothetical protein